MKLLTQRHGESRGLQVARQFWRFRTLYDDPAFTPDKLATISARTLIVHGDNDFVPITQALEMHHSIPSARLWIVPNGGHLPYLAQDNHVDFVRRVTEFLEGEVGHSIEVEPPDDYMLRTKRRKRWSFAADLTC